MATLRQTFKDIADAIREKGVSGTMKPIEMASKIESIQTGGGNVLGIELSSMVVDNDGVLDKPAPAPVRTTARSIGTNALRYGLTYSTEFDAPQCQTVDDYGLQYATFLSSTSQPRTELTSINFPELVSIGTEAMIYAWRYQTNLKSVSFPKLETVGLHGMSHAFENCTGLTDVELTAVREIGTYGLTYAFSSSLTSIQMSISNDIEFPNLESVGGYGLDHTFQNNSKLRRLRIDSPLSVASNSFNYMCSNCKNLEEVYIREIKKTGSSFFSYTFQNCSNLSSLYIGIPELTSVFGNYTFQGCSKLSSITFPTTRVINYQGSVFLQYAFANTYELHFPELTANLSPNVSSGQSTFRQCTPVKRMYFPKLTTITSQYMFYGVSTLSELHFGAANQAAIEATVGYATKWGAPAACSIIFDL